MQKYARSTCSFIWWIYLIWMAYFRCFGKVLKLLENAAAILKKFYSNKACKYEIVSKILEMQ